MVCALSIRRSVMPVFAAAVLVAVVPIAGAQEVSEAIRAYKLTVEHVQKTTTANKNLAAKMYADPALKAHVLDMSVRMNMKNIDAAIKYLDSNPAFSAVMNSTGISTRDYLLTSVQAGIASIVLSPAYVSQEQKGVDTTTATQKENIAFARSHPVEM